jgi:hypothetical protein
MNTPTANRWMLAAGLALALLAPVSLAEAGPRARRASCATTVRSCDQDLLQERTCRPQRRFVKRDGRYFKYDYRRRSYWSCGRRPFVVRGCYQTQPRYETPGNCGPRVVVNDRYAGDRYASDRSFDDRYGDRYVNAPPARVEIVVPEPVRYEPPPRISVNLGEGFHISFDLD